MPLEIHYSEKAEILDLTPYPKEMINEEFAIFGNREIRENNRCIYERDEHGLILINQTQYDVINIELSIFGERKTFWDAQIREGTIEVCPDNERIYHYSIRAKNPNLNMGLTICDRSTRVNLAFYERSLLRIYPGKNQSKTKERMSTIINSAIRKQMKELVQYKLGKISLIKCLK